LALNCCSFGVTCIRTVVYFLLRVNRSSWSRGADPGVLKGSRQYGLEGG
jgi:hypothetical protein